MHIQLKAFSYAKTCTFKSFDELDVMWVLIDAGRHPINHHPITKNIHEIDNSAQI